MAAEGREVDLEAALHRADLDTLLLSEEQQKRQKIVAKAHYRSLEVSPFVRQRMPQAQPTQAAAPADPCSKKQAGYICYLARQAKELWHYDQAIGLSAKQARGVIARLQAKLGVGK